MGLDVFKKVGAKQNPKRFQEFSTKKHKGITLEEYINSYTELEKDEKQMLVNVPKGYDKENPAVDFLRMKSFVATKNISDDNVLSENLINETVQSLKALMPLVKFINRAFE
jgi:uncharacterized protein (DUF2461 family)